MTAQLLYEAIGPLMRISRAAPFAIAGMRFRTSVRSVLDLSATTVTLRIGVPGQAALITQALTLYSFIAADPSYECTLSAAQTTVPTSAGYEYVFVDGTGRVLLSGPCVVVDHPRPV